MTELTQVEVSLTQWVKDFGAGQETGIPVPCGECHACCTKVNAQLYPNEHKLNFVKRFNKSENKYHLKHKPNGECIYLTPVGCSIHDRVPKVCRTFDCRFMGFFNIRDPKHEHINTASKRWIFINDNNELQQYLYGYFQIGVNMLPAKAGDPVDRIAKQALLSAYNKFFVDKNT